MVAVTGDQYVFMDVMTLSRAGAPSQAAWTLWTKTSPQAPQKYDLVHAELDCQARTMAVAGGLRYEGDAPATDLGAGGPMALPPESTGERIWLFACTRQDKYPSVPDVTSISDALVLADGLRSPEKALAKLLSDDGILAVAKDFQRVQSERGMAGLADRVETCYRDAAKAGPARVRAATAYCITLDVAAFKFDGFFRADVLKKTSQDPGATTPFYEDAAFSKRVARYAVATTIDHSLPDLAVFGTLADKALSDLVKILDQEPNGPPA